MVEAEMGVMQPQARDSWVHQKLKEATKDPPLETGDSVVLWHSHFRLLVPRLLAYTSTFLLF